MSANYRRWARPKRVPTRQHSHTRPQHVRKTFGRLRVRAGTTFQVTLFRLRGPSCATPRCFRPERASGPRAAHGNLTGKIEPLANADSGGSASRVAHLARMNPADMGVRPRTFRTNTQLSRNMFGRNRIPPKTLSRVNPSVFRTHLAGFHAVAVIRVPPARAPNTSTRLVQLISRSTRIRGSTSRIDHLFQMDTTKLGAEPKTLRARLQPVR